MVSTDKGLLACQADWFKQQTVLLPGQSNINLAKEFFLVQGGKSMNPLLTKHSETTLYCSAPALRPQPGGVSMRGDTTWAAAAYDGTEGTCFTSTASLLSKAS